MKKILVAFAVFVATFILCGQPAWALTFVGNPIPGGTLISGWYKDNATFYFQHGLQTSFTPASLCPAGQGTANSFQYPVTASNTYNFYYDQFDNVYLTLGSGNSSYQQLDPGHCQPGVQPYTLKASFTIKIDSQSPTIFITQPSVSQTTQSTIQISGGATDSEGNLSQAIPQVNGSATGQSPVSLSGANDPFTTSVVLKPGINNIQMTVADIVGHTGTSNIVTICQGTSSSCDNTGGGSTGGTTGGSTGGSSGGSTSSGSSSSSSSNNSSGGSSSNATSSPQALKFNSQEVLNLSDPYAGDKVSDPTQVQDTAALAGVTGKVYDVLILVILILFALCAVVINRFRPIFVKLDRDKAGLRRRIILIVTLPSLLPLFGLGFLGYQQLSKSVKNTLSSQLEQAAQTSALKLDREFSIRQRVLTKTASDILQIKSQYKTQQEQLTQKQTNCQALVKSSIPAGQYSKVTSSDDCLPFLTGFAQLANTSAKLNDYLNALTQGSTQATQDLTAQENQHVNELLGSVRDFFPDVSELDVVDASKDAALQATLPPSNTKQPTIVEAHKTMLTSAASQSLALLDISSGHQLLDLTYPVSDGTKNIGGVALAIDLANNSFIPTIWSSTPKPYKSDKVYFFSKVGEVVTPQSDSTKISPALKPLTNASTGKVYNLKLASDVYTTRAVPANNINWVVAVGAPANSILAPLAGIQRTALFAIAGFILLSMLLGIWFVSNIAEEVERLFRGAVAFAKGQLDYRIGLKSHDELQVLGDTMDQMAQDIKAAQEALIQKDKDFINIATHELKAPMTSIIGNLSMITDDGMGKVDDKARELIGQAYNGTVRLRDIVTDMLDIARLESGHAEFKLETIDIQKLTKDIVDMQQVPAQQAGLTLVYQPATSLPSVLADKNKLQIIITNFVSNAIKYNRPKGTIIVSHQLNSDKLITAVADTGLGIPKDQQAHMFEKFYRVQHQDRANVPGTGLGLHITKKFIEAMGGQVWFTSEHGKGTTFYFSLPLTNGHNPASQVQAAKPATVVG